MRRLLLLVAAGGLTLAACGADRADGPGATSATTVAGPVSTVDGAAVPEALQFSAPTVGGGTLDMAQFAGRTVAFWFWAPT